MIYDNVSIPVLMCFCRMREVELGGKKVLLIKENGEHHAIGTKCSHYGAPLAKGNNHDLFLQRFLICICCKHSLLKSFIATKFGTCHNS